MNDPLRFEKVSIEDAKKVLESTPAEIVKSEVQDWRWARTFLPPARLTETTQAWLAGLPETVRPTELAAKYPRIANKLCEVWRDRDACERWFQELTHDRRVVGSNKERRQGFPGNIPQEIATLRKHYFNPDASTTHWENNIYRR